MGGLIAIPALIKTRKKNVVPAINLAVCLIAIFVYIAHVFYPFIPVRVDPTDDVYGWNEVGKRATELYSTMPESSFLLCNRYETGGQLSFAMKEEVYVLRPGHITAFSFWQNEEELTGRDALYLTHSRYFCPPGNIYNFKKITKLKEIPLCRAGRKVRTFTLYHCKCFRGVK